MVNIYRDVLLCIYDDDVYIMYICVPVCTLLSQNNNRLRFKYGSKKMIC